jgi:hypothetical protein
MDDLDCLMGVGAVNLAPRSILKAPGVVWYDEPEHDGWRRWLAALAVSIIALGLWLVVLIGIAHMIANL